SPVDPPRAGIRVDPIGDLQDKFVCVRFVLREAIRLCQGDQVLETGKLPWNLHIHSRQVAITDLFKRSVQIPTDTGFEIHVPRLIAEWLFGSADSSALSNDFYRALFQCIELRRTR